MSKDQDMGEVMADELIWELSIESIIVQAWFWMPTLLIIVLLHFFFRPMMSSFNSEAIVTKKFLLRFGAILSIITGIGFLLVFFLEHGSVPPGILMRDPNRGPAEIYFTDMSILLAITVIAIAIIGYGVAPLIKVGYQGIIEVIFTDRNKRMKPDN
jgi:hypothetical protein